MRLASLVALAISPFIIASHVGDTPAAGGFSTPDTPAKEVTLTHWHMFLRDDNALIFTDGHSTRTFVLDDKNDKQRIDAVKSLMKHIAAIEPKTTFVIITGWHGDIYERSRSTFEELLLSLSSYDRHDGKGNSNQKDAQDITRPLFAVRYIFEVHNSATMLKMKNDGHITVPQSFIDDISG